MSRIGAKLLQWATSSAHILPSYILVAVGLPLLLLAEDNTAFFFTLLFAFQRIATAPLFFEEVLLSLDETRPRVAAFFISPAQLFFEYFDFLRLINSVGALAKLIVFSKFPHEDYLSGPLLCHLGEPNGDISGTGVLISAYILLFLVFISLLMGTFHGGDSGTKELGIAIMCSKCPWAQI